MDASPRDTDSLIKAGAVTEYCIRFKQTKGTHKERCKSARIHLLVDFPGVDKSTIQEIERLALSALSKTYVYKA